MVKEVLYQSEDWEIDSQCLHSVCENILGQYSELRVFSDVSIIKDKVLNNQATSSKTASLVLR